MAFRESPHARLILEFPPNPHEPWLSVREIAKSTKMPVATTGRVIKAFRDGLLDRDGFEYEKALV
jgi:DNA-binding IclR family transcriptional regulator